MALTKTRQWVIRIEDSLRKQRQGDMYLNMILQTTFPTNTSLSKLETSPELVKSKYYTDIDLEGHEISHFGGLPRELYFPKGFYIFSQWVALRENIVPRNIWLSWHHRHVIFHPSLSISADGQNEWFNQNLVVLYDYHNKTRSLHTKQTERTP